MHMDHEPHLGLYNKFKMLERTDGQSRPGGRHHGCRYFPLDLTHDEIARACAISYAQRIEKTNALLAADLRRAVAEIEAKTPVVAGDPCSRCEGHGKHADGDTCLHCRGSGVEP